MAPRNTIVCDRRLVDIDPITGYKFLAHARGEEITVEEYERLKPHNGGAVVVTKTTEPVDEGSESAGPKRAEDMKAGELIIEAKRLGVDIARGTKKPDVLAAVLEAQAKAAAEDEGTSDAEGDTGAGESNDESTDEGTSDAEGESDSEQS